MKISFRDIEYLSTRLPAFFRRADVREVTDGRFSPTYLAVLQHRRKGPYGERIGANFVYKREEFLRWLKEYYYGEDTGTGD